MPEECRAEMKKIELAHGLLAATEPPGIGQLMRCENFSSLRRLLAVTAYVLKFCRTLRSKVRHDSVSSTPDDFAKAEALWVAESQHTLAKDENFGQWRKQFDLFQDDKNIWRCRGQLKNADVSFSTMHPILLSKDHFLTTLFVRRAHERVMHSGVKATLTELRSQFWIVKGRNLVKRIIGQCPVC